MSREKGKYELATKICLSGYMNVAGGYVRKTVTTRCDMKVVLRLPRTKKIGIVSIA